MQTTLRLDDRLYRAAKAEAAREGISLTRLVEDGIRLRLGTKPAAPGPYSFRVLESPGFCPTDEELRRLADEDQLAHDLKKLGLPPTP
ncbi:MAG: hypothetical protein RL376_11 [Verrucomicrobiota bacterium]|jgi:hypothetical protein